MDGRINTIKPMRQYANGRKAVGKGRTVCMNINTISQPTYNKYLRTEDFQIAEKRSTKLFTILSSVAGTYHINNAKRIQIGISFEKKNNRGIITFAKTGRVTFIGQSKTLNMVLLRKFILFSGTYQCLWAIQCLHHTVVHSRQTFGKFLPETKNISSTSNAIHQLLCPDMSNARNLRQGNATNALFATTHCK